MVLRAAMVLIGLTLILGAASQVIDPPAADDVIADCDHPQLDEAVAPTLVTGVAEPPRLTTIAVYDRGTSIGRIASYAPFRPPRAATTAN